MKVIIAGSRMVKDYRVVETAVKKSGFEINEVVSGTAKGVDRLGEQWARHNKIPVKEFPADWNDLSYPDALIKKDWRSGLEYDARAGFRRNAQMALYADALIAVWNGKTRGTANMIKQARKVGLKLFIHRI